VRRNKRKDFTYTTSYISTVKEENKGDGKCFFLSVIYKKEKVKCKIENAKQGQIYY
jgi:hypothetical protein